LVKKFDQDRKTVKDKQLKTAFEIRKEKPEENSRASLAADRENNPSLTGHIPGVPPLAIEAGEASGSPPESATGRRGRPLGSVAERDQLRGYLVDFARELHDEAPLPATITRVLTLFRQAGTPAGDWPDYLYRARAITQERTAQIRAGSGTGPVGRAWSPKNKVPYFLAVLEDLLGLRESGGSPPASPPTVESFPEGPGRPRTVDRPRGGWRDG
jgi:hypothetical protein